MVEYFLRRTPMLRPLLAFVSGILLANFLAMETGRYYWLFAPLLMWLISGWVPSGAMAQNRTAGFLLLGMFGMLGVFRQTAANRPPDRGEADGYWVMLLERPAPTARSFRAEGLLTASQSDTLQVKQKERMLIYFTSTISPDSLAPGTLLYFKEHPVPLRKPTNPYAFDYARWMQRKKIYRQVYLSEGTFSAKVDSKTFNLRVRAERIREKLLRQYEQSGLEGDALAILSALTLGQRKLLEPEVRDTFAAAGATHVLAVSGLHVGILFLAFNLFFSFLKQLRLGRYFFVASAIMVLWLYALITGLSPSVQRAALMFSLLQIGLTMRRPVNVYNTLAGSAMLLLLFNPMLLFEVGFQLSYAAVTAIVYFQPKIAALGSVKNRAAKYIWELTAVSVAAQLGTFAIAGYYFNQFPVWFLLTNLLVIPAAMVFVFLGMAILATGWSVPISGFFAILTRWLLLGLYTVLQWIEGLPAAVYSGFLLDGLMVFILIAGLIILVILIESRRIQYLRWILITGILFYGYAAGQKWINYQSAGLVVYDYREPVIHLYAGRKNYIITTEAVLSNEPRLYMVDQLVQARRLKDPVWLTLGQDYTDQQITIKGRRAEFAQRSILLPSQISHPEMNEYFDYSIELTGRGRGGHAGQRIILGYMNGNPENASKPNIHAIRSDGAYHQKFNKTVKDYLGRGLHPKSFVREERKEP